MSHGGPIRIKISELTIPSGSGWARIEIVAWILGVIGVGASLAMRAGDTKQFAFSWLVAFLFWLSIALGGLFFVLVHHATKSGWGVVVRRLSENIMATLPLLALLFIPVYLGIHDLFEWSHSEAVATDHLLQGKVPFLNESFFTGRALVYFGLWSLIAVWYFARSRRQDKSGDEKLTHAMIRFGGPGIIVFALTSTLAAFDWGMSLYPHWYSTIYGVYFFAGCLVGVFSLLILLASALRGSGYLKDVITLEHFQDLGKLLFAFCVFWAYIGFSQFFLIWYANIPEETEFYLHRLQGGWETVTIVLALGHFAVPFLCLMPRTIKRKTTLLSLGAVWMLGMHFLDIHWLVMPTLHHHVHFSLLDILTFVGIGGLFLGLVLRLLRGAALVPVRDPRLIESITFENS